MARALPENWRPASRVLAGHEIFHIHRSVWLQVVDREFTATGIRFVLADDTYFHASLTQQIQSRYQPKES